jgi:iron complex transport system substrate-binding protein
MTQNRSRQASTGTAVQTSAARNPSRRVFAGCLPGFALAAVLGASMFPGLAQAQGAAIKVSHARGELTLPAMPKNILVFDLASLDTLQALQVEVAGVPEVKYPAYLAKYASARYKKVGSLFEPNYEAVTLAKPDLIIIGGRSAAKYPELAKIAPTIDLTVDPKNLPASVTRNAELLGRVFGKEARARELTDKIAASIAGLKQQAATQGKGLAILTTGGKMSAYGPGSRFGVLHDSFGIVPAQPNLSTTNHGQAISFEFILQTNPDWLFVLDRDAAIGREGASAQRFLDNELVRKSTAWSKKQVVYLNAANWYLVGGAGVTAMQENIDQLSTAFRNVAK